MDLQQFIEQVCRARGITRSKFAKTVGLSEKTLRPSKTNSPSAKTLMACASLANTDRQRDQMLQHYGLGAGRFQLPKDSLSLTDAISLYSNWSGLTAGQISRSVQDTNAYARNKHRPTLSTILKYRSIFSDVGPILAFYEVVRPSGKPEHTLQECLKRAVASGRSLGSIAAQIGVRRQRVHELLHSKGRVRLATIHRFKGFVSDLSQTMLAHGYIPPENFENPVDNTLGTK